MSDKLERIFEQQAKLQQTLNAEIHTQEYINTMFLACIAELTEALNETVWKPWKKEQHSNKQKFQQELADVFTFFINLCLAADLNAHELFGLYMQKNKINFQRQLDNY